MLAPTPANETDPLAIFAQNVKDLAVIKGITQEQLAEACGIPRPTVSLIMRGKRELRLTTAQKIAESLGVDLGYLMTPHEIPLSGLRAS